MKNQLIVLGTLGVLVLATAVPGFAAKKKNGQKNSDPVTTAPTVLSRYDKNSNGKLDDTEREAIRAALPNDPALKPFDKNGDGKLDDDELAEIEKPTTAPAETPKQRKNKKK